MSRDLVYGLHPVQELLAAQPKQIKRLLVVRTAEPRLDKVLEQARVAGVRVENVSRKALHDLVGQAVHQGLVAQVQPFAYADFAALKAPPGKAPLLVALDQVQDPHNLGALIRSAYALGAHGLFFPKDRACEITPTVVKSAAGATAHLPIARVTNLRRALDQLKEAGLWVVGTAPEGAQLLHTVDLCQPIVLVVGSEGSGMRKTIAEACDFLVQIPMAGHLGSLNASVAGAIGLYETARQRASVAISKE